jgi:RsiW-degrading membrane proteinase PrsW (M82 family)
MPVSLTTWQMAGLIFASALFWMHYVQSKDRLQPEPRARLLGAFGLGVVACVLSVLVFSGLDALGVPDVAFGERPWTAVYCFGIVGPTEEGAKVLVACLVVHRWREYDEPIDGFVYAAAIALGFACMENLFDTSELSWQRQLAHTLALPITHVLFSSVWGFGLAYARFSVSQPFRRRLWQIGSVALSMFLHGLHDFLIFAYQASLVTSGLALMIWMFVIWRARLLARQAMERQRTLTQEASEPPIGPK